MSAPEAVAASALAMSPSGYAGLAAARMMAERPGLTERFGESAFSQWKEHLTNRVRELASALEVGTSEGFARSVSWTKTSFESRAIDIGDLEASLRCLREVLATELAEGAGSAATRYLDAALEVIHHAPTEAAQELRVDTRGGQIAALYLKNLLEGHAVLARTTVLDAVDRGSLNILEAYTDVLLPAQREIGRLWHLNEVSVAEEHYVTGNTRMVMNQLLARADAAEPRNLTVLTAAVEGNAHEIAIQAVADLFEMDGWNVIHLGGDVPGEEIAAAVRDFAVDLAALSATLDVQRSAVASVITQIRAVSPARVLVGGPALLPEGLWQRVGADGYAATMLEATRIGAELVQKNPGKKNPGKKN